jgi:hypothetical protein
LLAEVKSKRYTLARVKRLILSAYLGITKADTASPPQYLRILSYSEKGKELLSFLAEKAALPVITKNSQLSLLGSVSKRQFELEKLAGDLWRLALPNPQPFGQEGRWFIGFPNKSSQ